MQQQNCIDATIFLRHSRPMKTLATVQDVFAALGGTAAVRQLLAISAQQVSNMRSADSIPPKHYLRLSQALGDRYKLSPVIFRARTAA